MEPYQRLEHELAVWVAQTGWPCTPQQVVACSSGTAALHLALEALELPAGSEVLVPDYTMIACARAVTLAGLTPVFVDCDERLLMSPHLFERWRNSTPDVVMPVHVYGRRVHEDVFFHADQYNWYIVEDLAEAHGVAPHPETDAACWSFYKNKIVAGEEGGAVAFKDVGHARVARELRSLGFTEAHDFRHRPRGHNYRLADCLAEKVLDKLDRWDVPLVNATGQRGTILEMRREAEEWYDDACPAEWRMPPRDVPWVYDLRIPGLGRDRMAKVVQALNRAWVQARMGFLPMSCQPEYPSTAYTLVKEGRGANSWAAADEVLYLPLTPGVVTREACRLAFDVLTRELS